MYYRLIVTQIATPQQNNQYNLLAFAAFNLCTGTIVTNSFMQNGLVYPQIALTSNNDSGYVYTKSFNFTEGGPASMYLWTLSLNRGQTYGSIKNGDYSNISGWIDFDPPYYTGVNSTYSGATSTSFIGQATAGRFQGIVTGYNSLTGAMIISNIANVYGSYTNASVYYVNLHNWLHWRHRNHGYYWYHR
jgi:hypothetical protein